LKKKSRPAALHHLSHGQRQPDGYVRGELANRGPMGRLDGFSARTRNDFKGLRSGGLWATSLTTAPSHTNRATLA
jgi:hypothetical protein